MYYCSVHDLHWVPTEDGKGYEPRPDLAVEPTGPGIEILPARERPWETGGERADEQGERQPEARLVRPHRWVYYPKTDVYYCSIHDRYWVRQADAQKYTERRQVEGEVGAGVELVTTVDRPWETDHVLRPDVREDEEPAREHRWIYYPEADIYYCAVHDQYFARLGSGKTYEERPGIAIELGPGIELEVQQGDPWNHR